MALQRQNVPLSLAGGIDTKTDPFQVMAGKLLILENGIFTSPKSIRKRNGYGVLSQMIADSTISISSGAALATYNEELDLFDGDELYSFSQSTQKWIDKGPSQSLALSSTAIIRNTFQQTTPDSAFHPSGLEVFTWEDSRGGSRYSVIDSTTGQTVVSDLSISATAIKPKPFAIGNYLVIIYVETATNHLRLLPIPIVNPLAPLAVTDLALDIDTVFPNYDACLSSTRIYFAYNNSSGGTGISLKTVDRFLTLSAATVVTGENANGCIGVAFDLAQNQFWVSYDNTAEVKYFIYNSTLSATPILAPTVIEVNSNTILNITAAANGGIGKVFYSQIASETYNNFTNTATLTSTGTISNLSVFLRSVSVAGKAFFYDSNIYVTVVFDTVLQPTYFTVNSSNKRVVAKFSPDVAGGTLVKNIVPEMVVTSPGNFLLASLIKDLFTTISGAIYTQTGVNAITLDFVAPGSFQNIELGNNLIISGAQTTMYDGISVVEYDFNMFPENITETTSATGGAIGPGTRQYSVVYAWMDNEGQTHYSAPSIPITDVIVAPSSGPTFTSVFAANDTSITVSSTTGLIVGQTISDVTTPATILPGTAITSIVGSVLTLSQPTLAASASSPGDTLETLDTASVTLTIPTLRVTDKVAPRGPVIIIVYRTEDSQDTFYQVSSVTSPIINDTSVDTVTFVDTEADAEILGNPTLYTNGGVVENIAPPASSYVTTFMDRVILIPEENGNQFWYSKQVIPGVPVEFSDLFVENIDAIGGDLIAGARMDGNFILLKESLLFYITGSGPDATGGNNTFSDPQPIACDGGCIDKKSVILTPAGLLYKSQKGIYLLTRNLIPQYIGADVEAFNNNSIVSVNLIENTQQVRFCLDNNTALVYDYFMQQWSVFTNHNAADSVIFQGEFTYLNPSGQVFYETPGQYTDNGNFIKLKIQTAWLSFAGLQSFQRVYRMLFLGAYFNPHNLIVQAAYDFNPYATQQSVVMASKLQTGVYGSDAVYGKTSPYGGSYPLYQYKVNFTRQKCESIQLTFEDAQTTLNYGQNFSMSSFAFEVGQKTGLNKMPATNIVS